MSFVVVAPEMLAAAATDLENIGSALSAAHAAASAPTAGVLAAGADEVSAALASLFSGHAQAYQALSAEAAAFHQQFVQTMTASGAMFASEEAANAKPMQAMLNTRQRGCPGGSPGVRWSATAPTAPPGTGQNGTTAGG